ARRSGRARCGRAPVPSAPARPAVGPGRRGRGRPSTRSSSRASACSCPPARRWRRPGRRRCPWPSTPGGRRPGSACGAPPGRGGAPDMTHARRWWILGVLSLCVVVIGVDNTILNVALPSIVRSLDASGSQLQWMVDAYTIVFACLLLTAGSLGDRYGRRRALLFGLASSGVSPPLAAAPGAHALLSP